MKQHFVQLEVKINLELVRYYFYSSFPLHGFSICKLYQGDSGSSLQYIENDRWVQVGVVSFGAATGCSDDHPNGYTRIAYYLDWIEEITGLSFA